MFTFDPMNAQVITGIHGVGGGRAWDHPDRVRRRAITGPVLSHVDRALGMMLPGYGIGALYPGYLFTFPDGGAVIQKDGKLYGHVRPEYLALSATYSPPVPRLQIPVALLTTAGVPLYNVSQGQALFFDLSNAPVTVPDGYRVVEWADIVAAGWQAEEDTAEALNAGAMLAAIETAKGKIWRYQESELHFPVYAVRFMGIDWFMTVPWYFPAYLGDGTYQLPYTGVQGIILAPAELVALSGQNSPFAPGNYVPRLWGDIRDTDYTIIAATMAAEYQAHRAEQLARLNELGAGGEIPSYAFAPQAFFRDAGTHVRVDGFGVSEAAVVDSLVATGAAPRSGAKPIARWCPAVKAKRVEGVTDAMIQAAHDAIMAEVMAAQGGTGRIPDLGDIAVTDGGQVSRPGGGGDIAEGGRGIGYADPSPDASWNPDDIVTGEGAQSGSFGSHGGGGGVSTGQVLGYAAQIMAWYEQGSAAAMNANDVPAEMSEGGYVMGVMEGYTDFKNGDYIGGAAAAIAVCGSALQKAKILDRSFPWKAFASSIASGAAAGAAAGAGFAGVGAGIGAAIGAAVGAIACVIGWLCGRNPRGTVSGVPYAAGVPAWAKTYAPQAFIDWLWDLDMAGVFNRGVEECQQALVGWSVDEYGHVLDPVEWAGALDPDAWTGQRWSVAYPFPASQGHSGGTISDADAEEIRRRTYPDFTRCAWVYQAYRALGINYEESLAIWRATGQKGFVYIDQKVLASGADGGVWGAGFGSALGGGLLPVAALGAAAYAITKK